MKNSAAMEKEGLERSLKYLTEEGLSVNALITDRDVQIRKYMREKWPAVKHRLDGWHVGKGALTYITKTITIYYDGNDCDAIMVITVYLLRITLSNNSSYYYYSQHCM